MLRQNERIAGAAFLHLPGIMHRARPLRAPSCPCHSHAQYIATRSKWSPATSRCLMVCMQASRRDSMLSHVESERAALETSLTQVLNVIPLKPQTAFEMYTQTRLDELGIGGCLPAEFDVEGLQKQLIQGYDSMQEPQRQKLEAQGQKAFRDAICTAHIKIQEVCHNLFFL